MSKKRPLLILSSLLILTSLTLFLGSIPPSPLYYLKISRETIQSFFIFGDEDQANWLLTKADKRLTEAEKLRRINLNAFAQMQINTAKSYQLEAEKLLIALKDKTNINYLKDKSNQNSEKMKALEQ